MDIEREEEVEVVEDTGEYPEGFDVFADAAIQTSEETEKPAEDPGEEPEKPEDQGEEDPGDPKDEKKEEKKQPEDPQKIIDALQATLAEEREKKRQAQLRLEALGKQQEQKPEEPAFNWQEPEKTVKAIEEKFDRRLQTVTLDFSEKLAKTRHADYDEKYKVFEQMALANNAYVTEMLKQPDPAEWAYMQASKQMSLAEIGDDPEAYKNSLREQIKAEVLAELKQNEIETKIQKAADVKLPPGAAKIKGQGSKTEPVVIDDPLGALFGDR